MTNFADFLKNLDSGNIASLNVILHAFNDDDEIRCNDIEDIGYDSISGYVWLELENGITLISYAGQIVEYMTVDVNGNKIYHANYYEATNHLLGV
jgi:hypothetical protein